MTDVADHSDAIIAADEKLNGSTHPYPPLRQATLNALRMAKSRVSAMKIAPPGGHASSRAAANEMLSAFDALLEDMDIAWRCAEEWEAACRAERERRISADREAIARAIYDVTIPMLQPNFPDDFKLPTFDDCDDRTRNLHFTYADAVLALGLGRAFGDRRFERIQTYPHTEESCPGHAASSEDPKVCGRCGTHVHSLRPDDDVQF
jgi:hypothetical protein